jgi:GEVED domain/Secretion system C-terminal sorting domain
MKKRNLLRSAFIGAATLFVASTSNAQVTVVATAGNPGPTVYATVDLAFQAINAGTHQGVIGVGIGASTTEAGPCVLNSSGAGAASYTSVTIQPIVDGVTISGPTATGRGLIELNGADNVTIDGDNPNTGGINRNLTLTNTAAATTPYNSVIRVALSTVVLTADNNIVRNCIINGNAPGGNVASASSTIGSENTTFGIFVGPNASTVSATTAPNAVTSVTAAIAGGQTALNFQVQNNQINACARGIAVNGGATTVATGLSVTDNIIGSATPGTTSVYARGISVSGFSSATISTNTIQNIGFFVPTSTQGIFIGESSANTTGAVVTRNNITNVINSNTGTYGAYGINLGAGNNHIVSNNFVSGINHDMSGGFAFSTTFGVFGIRVISGSGHTITYNSVNMYGARIGTANSSLLSSALAIGSTGQFNCTVTNNVLVNTMTGGTTTVASVSLYLPSGATSGMNLTLNNNFYYDGTTSGQSGILQISTTYSTANLYTSANFIQAATAPATNSRSYTSTLNVAGTNDNASWASSVAAPFTSNSDLHVNLAATNVADLDGRGVVNSVTIDYDNATRSVTTPDIGADEYTQALCSGANGGTATIASSAICAGQTVNMSSSGATVGGGITYQWQVATVSGGPYTNVSGGSGANTTSYTTGTMSAGTYYYVLQVTCSVGPVSAVSNEVSVVVNALPTVAVTPTTGTFCLGGDSLVLSASGASTYVWSPSAGLSSSTGITVNAAPSAATTYTIVGVDGNGCLNSATTAIAVAASVVMDSVVSSSSAVCPGDSSTLISYAHVNVGTYCQPTYTNGTGFGDYVSLVQLGSINNATLGSPTPYYTFYAPSATTTTTLVAGNTYTVTISPGTYTINDVAAWIDFNANGILNDGGEKLGETDNMGAAPATTSFVFTVPVNALNGTTRLRVRDMDHGGTNDMDPCAAQSAWGETEDYTVTIVGGVDPFSYLWTPSTFLNTTTNDTVNVNGITSTTEYFATVTAASGCFATDSITVTVNTLPTVVANASANPICAGDSLNLYGSGAGSYVWNNSVIDSVTFLPAVADTFIVIGTDSNGCVNTDSLILTINPLPTVALSGNNLVCSGDSTMLTGTSGGTSQWYLNGSPIVGATSNTYYATAAGVYNMTKTNLNGCSDSAATGITVTVVLPPTVTVSGNSAICNGDSTTLTASGANTYTWVNGPATASNTVMPTADSTFWVVGLDATATCSDSAMFMVTVNPTYMIPQNVHLCFGDSVTVGSNTYYNAGVYNDTMSTVNGCDSIFITTVTIDTAILSSTQSVIICSGDSVVVGSSVYTTAGTYLDTLTSSLGCDSVVTTTVTLTTPVTTSQSVSVCFGGSYTIGLNTYTASGTYSDTLSNIGGCDSVVVTTLTVAPQITTSQTINACNVDTVFVGSNAYTTSGVYVDTLTSINGCDSIVTSNINFGGLNATVTTTNFGGTLVASPSGLSYQWMNCQDNTTIISATMQNYTPSANGQFAVIVSDTSGCIDTSSCVTVTTVDVEETIALNEMSVYPNPNSGLFTIAIPNADCNEMTIEVISIDGKVIYSNKFSNVSGTFTNEVDMTDAANGTYFLRVTADGTTSVVKVVRAE